MLQGNAKRTTKKDQLKVSDPAGVGFDLRDGVTGDVPAQPLAFCRECRLREAAFVSKAADLFTDDIFADATILAPPLSEKKTMNFFRSIPVAASAARTLPMFASIEAIWAA